MSTSAPDWFSKAIATPPEESFLEVEGCKIHQLRWGNRGLPGLVLVHGGAAHAHWWSFLAPMLMDHYDVIAFDLSGHGDSGRRDNYPREPWANEAKAVIEAAKFPSPPVLIGHSMGGLVTIVTASLHGDLLKGAIIVDSPVNKPNPESQAAQSGQTFHPPKVYPTLEQAMSRFRLIPEQPTTYPYIIDYIARTSLKQVEGGWSWKFDPKIFVRFSREEMSAYLSSVKCRVALLRGEFSKIVPVETGEYMYELLGRSSPLVEIPQAHHHLLLDQPLAFIAATRALLADWEHSLPMKPPVGKK